MKNITLIGLAGLIVSGAAGCTPQQDARSTAVTPRLVQGDCKRCHQEVWNEWTQSTHHMAWESDDVQAAFRNFGYARKCQTCHAPLPVFVTGIDVAPQLRDHDPQTGVNCISCHLLPDGDSVAAVRSNNSVACQPVQTNMISDSAMCGTCHDAIYDDWKTTRYAGEGRTCVSCHMRKHDGEATKITHECKSGFNLEAIDQILKITCQQEGSELMVSITNHGVGHNFPGERHNRTLAWECQQFDADDEPTEMEKKFVKGVTPFRGESTAEKIKADETVNQHFSIESGSVKAIVKLIYKRFPMASSEQIILFEKEVPLSDSR